MDGMRFSLQLNNLGTSPLDMSPVTGTDKITGNVTPINRIKRNGRHDFEVMPSPIAEIRDDSSEKVRTIVTPSVAVERERKLLDEFQ